MIFLSDPYRVVTNRGDAEGHNADVHLHGGVVAQAPLFSKLRLQSLDHRKRVQHPRPAEKNRGHHVERRQHPREVRAVRAKTPIDVGHAPIHRQVWLRPGNESSKVSVLVLNGVRQCLSTPKRV